MQRSYAIFLRYFYLVRTNAQRFFMLFIWSAIDIVLWGFLTKYLGAAGVTGYNFTAALLGAIILWSFLIRAQQGVSTPALEDIWSRNLFNYFASPLKVGEYALGLIFSSIITSVIGLAFMLLFALTLFGFSIAAIGIKLAGFVLILFIFGVTLGLLAVGLLLRYGPSAEWLIWPMPALIQPFAGVLYPVSVLPQWMQGVAQVLPPTHVFEGMRGVIFGTSSGMHEIALGFATALVWLGLIYVVFVRIYRAAVRTGRIARFNAESG